MLFYLCMIYLQKQINVLVEQHPSIELKKPTAVYLPPGIAGHGFVQKNQVCQTGKRNSILGPINKLTLSTVIFVS